MYNEEIFNKKKRSMSIVIGNCLSRNPIFKKRVVMGKTQYKVNFEEFRSLLKAKNFLSQIVELVDSVECVESKGGVTKEEKIEFQNLNEWSDDDKKRLENTEKGEK